MNQPRQISGKLLGTSRNRQLIQRRDQTANVYYTLHATSNNILEQNFWECHHQTTMQVKSRILDEKGVFPSAILLNINWETSSNERLCRSATYSWELFRNVAKQRVSWWYFVVGNSKKLLTSAWLFTTLRNDLSYSSRNMWRILNVESFNRKSECNNKELLNLDNIKYPETSTLWFHQ